MELSRHVISVSDHPKIGMTLIFNVFNGKAMAISMKRYNELRSLPNSMPRWLSAESSAVAFLRENFLVESREVERQSTVNVLGNVTQSRRRISLAILTTTDCNMACPYCHEGLRKKKLYMSPDTAEYIADFATRHLAAEETSELWLYFYGGEPLLNPDPMESIIARLESYVTVSRGRIAIVQDMSTNGTLLTRSMAKQLNRFGLHTTQVTLDGPPEVHDRRRCFKGGRGTFWTIVKNIGDVLDLMEITIRINIDRQNWNTVPDLLEILISEGLHQHVSIYPDFVTNTFENQRHCRENVLTDLDDQKKLVEIWHVFDQYGISLPGLKFTEGMCGNLGLNSLAIDPCGNLYSCIGFVGDEKYAISDIQHFPTIRADYVQQRCKPYLACLDCSYLPVCGGGCRVQAYLKSGGLSAISCNKAFLDYAYPEFLRLKFKSEL